MGRTRLAILLREERASDVLQPLRRREVDRLVDELGGVHDAFTEESQRRMLESLVLELRHVDMSHLGEDDESAMFEMRQ